MFHKSTYCVGFRAAISKSWIRLRFFQFGPAILIKIVDKVSQHIAFPLPNQAIYEFSLNSNLITLFLSKIVFFKDYPSLWSFFFFTLALQEAIQFNFMSNHLIKQICLGQASKNTKDIGAKRILNETK